MLLILILFITIIVYLNNNKQANNKIICDLNELISKKNTFMLIIALIHYISIKQLRQRKLILQNQLLKKDTKDKSIIFNKGVHKYDRSVSILCGKTPSKILTRSMHSRLHKIYTQTKTLLVKSTSNNQPIKKYATYIISNPKVTESSPEALKNNPALTLHRKNSSKVIQHKEIVVTQCNQLGCLGKICIGLCGVQKGQQKAVGHLTHSEEHGNLFSETDLEGKKKPQFLVQYETPHTVPEKSLDIDEPQSEILNKILENMQKNDKQ